MSIHFISNYSVSLGHNAYRNHTGRTCNCNVTVKVVNRRNSSETIARIMESFFFFPTRRAEKAEKKM